MRVPVASGIEVGQILSVSAWHVPGTCQALTGSPAVGVQLAAMRHPIRGLVVVAVVALALGRLAGQSAPPPVAIVGATLIDGNGGAPLRDAVLVVEGARIAQVGPRAAVTIPAG